MTVHPMPRRYVPEPTEDMESVYRDLRSRNVPPELALRVARALHPPAAPAPIPTTIPAPVVVPMPIIEPSSRWQSPEEALLDGSKEWWENNWLILAVVLGGLLIAAGWVLYAAVIIAWIVARAIWIVFLTILAGAAGGMMAALLRR